MLRHLKLIEQTIAATNIDSEPHRRWKLRRACSLSYSGLHPHGKLSFSRVPLVIMNYRKSYRGARGLSELGVWVCGGYYDRGAFHCLVLAGELSSIITHHVMISIWRWIEPPHLTISHQRGMTLPMSASPHSRSSQTPAPHLPNANEAELPPLRCHENGSSALEIPSAFLSRYSIQPALSAFPLHQA